MNDPEEQRAEDKCQGYVRDILNATNNLIFVVVTSVYVRKTYLPGCELIFVFGKKLPEGFFILFQQPVLRLRL